MFRRVVTILKDRFHVGTPQANPAPTAAPAATQPAAPTAVPAVAAVSAAPTATAAPSSPSAAVSTSPAGTAIDFSGLAAPTAALQDALDRAEQHALDQNTNRTQTGAAAREFEPLRAIVAGQTQSIAGVARQLKGQVPGIGVLTAPSTHRRAENYVVAVDAFVRKAEIYQDVLVQHGLQQDFVAQLDHALNAFKQSLAMKGIARASQKASTNGLKSEIKFGQKSVRIIDAVMKQALRNSPADLAAWRSARRIVKNPASSAPVFLPVQIAPHPVSAVAAVSTVSGTPVVGTAASPVASPVPGTVVGTAAAPAITKS